MDRVTYKGVEFERLDRLTNIPRYSLLTFKKHRKMYNRLYYTDGTNGRAYFVDIKSNSIDISTIFLLIPLPQGDTIKVLDNSTLFLSTTGGISYLTKAK